MQLRVTAFQSPAPAVVEARPPRLRRRSKWHLQAVDEREQGTRNNMKREAWMRASVVWQEPIFLPLYFINPILPHPQSEHLGLRPRLTCNCLGSSLVAHRPGIRHSAGSCIENSRTVAGNCPDDGCRCGLRVGTYGLGQALQWRLMVLGECQGKRVHIFLQVQHFKISPFTE